MKLSDMVSYSLNALQYRKLRSWLTVLGIVVGIATIVILIGLVQGLKDDITEELEGFGASTIIVTPRSTSTVVGSSFMPTQGKLYLNDYERIKRLGAIEYITPVIIGRTYADYRDHELTLSVYGIYPEVFKQTTDSVELESGRFLTDADRKSVVIGYNIAHDLFDDELQVSSKLYLSGEPYTVVGVLKKTGSAFTSFDDAVFIPFEEAETMFSDTMAEDEVTAIRITVKEDEDPEEVSDEIETILLAAHHVTEDEKDFSIVTSAFINQQLDSITELLTLFMGAIAGIALIVGGVGISNTMFMSILERTKEIGTIKALGATPTEIERLFLVESSLIGLIGGFAGLILAFALIWVIDASGIAAATFVPWVAFGALAFSVIIGIAAGVFPARQGARLDPIEALRYE